MLVIRDAQLKVFGEALRRQFLRKAAAHLARFFPEAAAMAGPDRRAFVERNVAKLEKRGFVAENDLIKLLGLLLLFGEDLLEKQKWAQSYLGGTAGPTLRVNRLLDRGIRELRRAEKASAKKKGQAA